MVYLTGAGPGDTELLTLKAARVIQTADIIIYDRLANPDILNMAKKSVVLTYVGKENKKHTVRQEQINEIIYQASLKHTNVVRLKGETLLFLDEEEKKPYICMTETLLLK